MSDLHDEIEALKAENAELRRRLEWLENPRLGPHKETPAEIEARTKRMVDTLTDATRDVPPVDRSNLCTTDGRPVAEARASQTNDSGQHPSYIVLCDAERAKGFVRPYRDSYKHLTCGGVTTMGRALSETYARDPSFYGATFCVQCNRHLPVAEFIWTADGQQVGS